MPALHRRHVAVAERCVVYEGEVNEISAFRCNADDCVSQCPNEYLRKMCGHQERHGRNHDGNQLKRLTCRCNRNWVRAAHITAAIRNAWMAMLQTLTAAPTRIWRNMQTAPVRPITEPEVATDKASSRKSGTPTVRALRQTT